ncbi:MAG: DUF1192 domain-containing protein [Sneathiella sp.]|nr:DUF1192 domain-containing protein [Sneathiella sp.]
MASDDDDQPLAHRTQVNFDTMSIEELKDYIADLTAEIEKTKQVIEKKQAAQNAASGFFKK